MNNEVTTMPELPKGWVRTRLGDVLGFVKGKKPKNLGTRNNLLTIPYIDINAFENEIFDEFTDGDKCPLCQTDDILIVWDGARCGLVGRRVAGAIGSTLAKLPCFEVNSTYIFYFLHSMYEFINKRPRGVGIPHVEPSLFWNIPLPLPPLPEQHRIVAKIEELFARLDAGVEALKKIKTQLKRYRQAVLKHAFEGKLTAEWRQVHQHELEPASILLERIKQERQKVAKSRYKGFPPLDNSDLPELPEGWGWSNFEELKKAERNSIKAGPFGSSLKKESYASHGYKIYGQEQVIRQNPFYGDYYVGEEKYMELKSCAVKPGDILISLVGTIGKVLILPEDSEPGIINPRLVKLSLEERLLDNKYIKSYIESSAVRDFFTLASHGETMEILNLGILRTLPIPVPPLAEQQRIVLEIEYRLSVADQIEKTVDCSFKQAERLRQSILKRAFEGKLVPQDPNDEPAEKLLERIKAERAERLAEAKATSKSKRNTHRKQMELL